MHLLSLACTCTLLFATCISDFANLLFWSGMKWHTCIQLLQIYHWSLAPILLFYKEYVAYKLPFWWLNFSDGSLLQYFFYLQVHQFYPFATHYWLGRDFWLKRFWMKWNFVSFYYVQNFRVLCYFHPGSYKMFQSFSLWNVWNTFWQE